MPNSIKDCFHRNKLVLLLYRFVVVDFCYCKICIIFFHYQGFTRGIFFGKVFNDVECF